MYAKKEKTKKTIDFWKICTKKNLELKWKKYSTCIYANIVTEYEKLQFLWESMFRFCENVDVEFLWSQDFALLWKWKLAFSVQL